MRCKKIINNLVSITIIFSFILTNTAYGMPAESNHDTLRALSLAVSNPVTDDLKKALTGDKDTNAIFEKLTSRDGAERKAAIEQLKTDYPQLAKQIDAYLNALPVSVLPLVSEIRKRKAPCPALNLDIDRLTLFQIEPIMRAMRDTRSFLMFEVGPGALLTYTNGSADFTKALSQTALKLDNIPPYVAHLDHNQITKIKVDKYAELDGKAREEALQEPVKRALEALDNGFTSIALDLSTLMLLKEQDVNKRLEYVIYATAKVFWAVAEHAKKLGVKVSIEIEVGDIGKDISTVEEAFTLYTGTIDKLLELAADANIAVEKRDAYTKELLELAKIVFMAAQLGSSHGYDINDTDILEPYAGGVITEAQYRDKKKGYVISRAKEIIERFGTEGIEILIAYHGFSGFPIESLPRLIDTGAGKVNINTDSQAEIWKVLQAWFPELYRELFIEAYKAAKDKNAKLLTIPGLKDNPEEAYEDALNNPNTEKDIRNRIIFGQKGAPGARTLFRGQKGLALLGRIEEALKRQDIKRRIIKDDYYKIRLEVEYDPVNGLTPLQALHQLTYERIVRLIKALGLEGSAAGVVKIDRAAELRLQKWQVAELNKAVTALTEQDNLKSSPTGNNAFDISTAETIEASRRESDSLVYEMVMDENGNKALLITCPSEDMFRLENIMQYFEYALYPNKIKSSLACPLNHKNAVALRKIFSFTAPSVLGTSPAFGTGYRWSQSGNVIQARVAKELNATLILAQQSEREITRTKRSFEEVLDLATWASFEAALESPWGADADHLKTEKAVEQAVNAGFTYYTYDPSDFIKNEVNGVKVEDLKGKALLEAFQDTVQDIAEQKRLLLRYSANTEFPMDNNDIMRICVKYYAGLKRVAELYNFTKTLKKAKGISSFDTEISIDETETETTPQSLLFISEELKRMGVKPQAIAPRFVGNFEKGVDYFISIDSDGNKIMDTTQFRAKLEDICKIAKRYGYKISVHSGSDKFSVYPILAEMTQGLLHAKTAGTTYLEELRVVAKNDPDLLRDIYNFSLKVFQKDRATYHLSTDLKKIPDLNGLDGERLFALLESKRENDDLRQVLHVSYGSVLTDPVLSEAIATVLKDHPDDHYAILGQHMKKHIELLGLQNSALAKSSPTGVNVDISKVPAIYPGFEIKDIYSLLVGKDGMQNDAQHARTRAAMGILLLCTVDRDILSEYKDAFFSELTGKDGIRSSDPHNKAWAALGLSFLCTVDKDILSEYKDTIIPIFIKRERRIRDNRYFKAQAANGTGFSELYDKLLRAVGLSFLCTVDKDILSKYKDTLLSIFTGKDGIKSSNPYLKAQAAVGLALLSSVDNDILSQYEDVCRPVLGDMLTGKIYDNDLYLKAQAAIGFLALSKGKTCFKVSINYTGLKEPITFIAKDASELSAALNKSALSDLGISCEPLEANKISLAVWPINSESFRTTVEIDQQGALENVLLRVIADSISSIKPAGKSSPTGNLMVDDSILPVYNTPIATFLGSFIKPNTELVSGLEQFEEDVHVTGWEEAVKKLLYDYKANKEVAIIALEKEKAYLLFAAATQSKGQGLTQIAVLLNKVSDNDVEIKVAAPTVSQVRSLNQNSANPVLSKYADELAAIKLKQVQRFLQNRGIVFELISLEKVNPDTASKMVQIIVDAQRKGALIVAEIALRGTKDNIKQALEFISKMRQNYPDVMIAAGSVSDSKSSLMATKAGANIIITPGSVLGKKDIENIRAAGCEPVPGVGSEEEAIKAKEANVIDPKVFPFRLKGVSPEDDIEKIEPVLIGIFKGPCPDKFRKFFERVKITKEKGHEQATYGNIIKFVMTEPQEDKVFTLVPWGIPLIEAVQKVFPDVAVTATGGATTDDVTVLRVEKKINIEKSVTKLDEVQQTATLLIEESAQRAAKPSPTGQDVPAVMYRIQPNEIQEITVEDKVVNKISTAESWDYNMLQKIDEFGLKGVTYSPESAPASIDNAPLQVALLINGLKAPAADMGSMKTDEGIAQIALGGHAEAITIPVTPTDNIVMVEAPATYKPVNAKQLVSDVQRQSTERGAIVIDFAALGIKGLRNDNTDVFIPNDFVVKAIAILNNLKDYEAEGKPRYHVVVYSNELTVEQMKRYLGVLASPFDGFINAPTVAEAVGQIAEQQQISQERIVVTMAASTIEKNPGVLGRLAQAVKVAMVATPELGEYVSYKSMLISSLQLLEGVLAPADIDSLRLQIENAPAIKGIEIKPEKDDDKLISRMQSAVSV